MKEARSELIVGRGRQSLRSVPNHLTVAGSCKELSRFGWDHADIAQELNVDVRKVDVYLMLAGAPREVRKGLESGAMSAIKVLEALEKNGSACFDELTREKDKAWVAEEHSSSPPAVDGLSGTNVHRLLTILQNQGEKDAAQLESLSGIRKAIIVSTLYTAKGRGQVRCTPKAERLKETGQIADGESAPRGQIYSFLSYEPCAQTAKPEQDAQSQEARSLQTMCQLMLMPDLVKTISSLEKVCTSRTYRLAGFH